MKYNFFPYFLDMTVTVKDARTQMEQLSLKIWLDHVMMLATPHCILTTIGEHMCIYSRYHTDI